MKITQLTDFHFAYQDRIRHWHPGSELYTGGDALITAVEDGWDISTLVGSEEHRHQGARTTTVYYFELTRSRETLLMPVISNPFVDRLVSELNLKLQPMPKDHNAHPRAG